MESPSVGVDWCPASTVDGGQTSPRWGSAWSQLRRAVPDPRRRLDPPARARIGRGLGQRVLRETELACGGRPRPTKVTCMPFKDTPGLRRIAAQALEARDTVRVRVVHHAAALVLDGSPTREGDTLEVPRRRVHDLVERGFVQLVD